MRGIARKMARWHKNTFAHDLTVPVVVMIEDNGQNRGATFPGVLWKDRAHDIHKITVKATKAEFDAVAGDSNRVVFESTDIVGGWIVSSWTNENALDYPDHEPFGHRVTLQRFTDHGDGEFPFNGKMLRCWLKFI